MDSLIMGTEASPTSTTSQQRSPQSSSILFRLPLEIRLEIYALVVRKTLRDAYDDYRAAKEGRPAHTNSLALLRLCSLIYTESRDVVAKETTACIQVTHNREGVPTSRKYRRSHDLMGYLVRSLILSSVNHHLLLARLSPQAHTITFHVKMPSYPSKTPPFMALRIMANRITLGRCELTTVRLFFRTGNDMYDELLLWCAVIVLLGSAPKLRNVTVLIDVDKSCRGYDKTKGEKYWSSRAETFAKMGSLNGSGRLTPSQMAYRNRAVRFLEFDAKWKTWLVEVKGLWVRDLLEGLEKGTSHPDQLDPETVPYGRSRRVRVQIMTCDEFAKTLNG